MTEDINKKEAVGGIQSKEQLKKFISEDALANASSTPRECFYKKML